MAELGALSRALDYLQETKEKLKVALNRKGARITDTTPFREYVDAVDNFAVEGEITKITITYW